MKIDPKRLWFTIITIAISIILLIFAIYLKNMYFLVIVIITVGVWKLLVTYTKIGDKGY